jgi:hypothetical protein
MTSLIFVDVDGVLNPVKPSGTHQAFSFTVTNGTFIVYLDPAQGKWLTDLAAETNSELVWCTYWEHNASKFIAPVLGLPEMPYIPIKLWKMDASLGSHKAHSALDYAGSNKFAYFDDEYDIGYHLTGSNGTHIYVDPEDGLQPHHIAQAKNYLMNEVLPACVVCNGQNGRHADYCSPVTVT